MLKLSVLALDLLQHQGPKLLWCLNSKNTAIFLLSPKSLYTDDLMTLLHLFMQNHVIDSLLWLGKEKEEGSGEARVGHRNRLCQKPRLCPGADKPARESSGTRDRGVYTHRAEMGAGRECTRAQNESRSLIYYFWALKCTTTRHK